MKITVQRIVGRTTLNVEVEGEKDVEALTKAATITTIPDACGLCDSTDVSLVANKSDQYTFIKVKCMSCTAASTMGQYKDGIGGFWKAFEIYNKDAKVEEPSK